jgi:hypothetical protein
MREKKIYIYITDLDPGSSKSNGSKQIRIRNPDLQIVSCVNIN